MRGEDDVASEIESHIALETERLIAGGDSAEAARAAALSSPWQARSSEET